MVQENEIITLLLGVGTVIFVIANHSRLRELPSSNILINGVYVLFAGWILTILEGFFLKQLLNLLEHTCYSIGAVLMAVWCWKIYKKKQSEK